MLENTFCHIPRVTLHSEAKLWEAGVHTWQQALECELPRVRRVPADELKRHVEASQNALRFGNARFFADGLPLQLAWRLFPQFREQIAYLDIETTGLRAGSNRISTIALYDGRRVFTYVQGENLAAFPRDIAAYGVLVTYNGASFDLPFLRETFGIPLDQAHIDLRPVLFALGFRGGLKGCERALGITRGALDGVDGFMAVALWREYRRNFCPGALDTLLAYNVEDVLHLETLLVSAYNRLTKSTPFADTHVLELPRKPNNPYRPDPNVIRRLHREAWWRFEQEPA